METRDTSQDKTYIIQVSRLSQDRDRLEFYFNTEPRLK